MGVLYLLFFSDDGHLGENEEEEFSCISPLSPRCRRLILCNRVVVVANGIADRASSITVSDQHKVDRSVAALDTREPIGN